MGFDPIIADPDAYRQAYAKPDASKNYEYIMVYVDDVLIESEEYWAAFIILHWGRSQESYTSRGPDGERVIFLISLLP